jgi:hypothetical protein
MSDVAPILFKLPAAVAEAIHAHVQELKKDRSIKTSVQDVYGWLAKSYLGDERLQGKFTAWLGQENLPDAGAEKVINFRMPVKLDLDLRINLGKLGYKLGRRLTLRQLFTFLASSFVENARLRSAYERFLQDRGRP